MIDLSKYTVHDLTHTLGSNIDGYEDSVAKAFDVDGWNAKWLRIYSHAGTHMDAPHHFGVSDQTIDDFNPVSFMGKAIITEVEISQKSQLIGLEAVKGMNSKIKPGDSLIIRTNWSLKLEETYYKSGLPRISKELAEWCVLQKIKMLGVEPLSVADVNNLDEVTEIHRILMNGGVIIIEGLKNLQNLIRDEVFLIALPLKVYKGDGAPARIIALEDNMD